MEDEKAKNIVIVDDERETVDALERVLRLKGYHTTSFLSGEEAMSYLRQCDEADRPNIIITDYRLREMSGIDLLISVKTELRESRIGVILISGFLSHSKVLQSMYTLADSFIEKPVLPETLLDTINLVEKKIQAENKEGG